MNDIKSAISEVHKKAEKTRLAQSLISGSLTEEQWVFFLFNISETYRCIEQLNLISEPDCLRTKKYTKDLLNHSFEKYKIYLVPSIKSYYTYITKLDKNLIKSHIYVKYLGDLYGGSIIKKSNEKFSTNFLDFENQGKCIAYIRDITKNCDIDEAIVAFEKIINIYDEIYDEFTRL